MTKHGIRMFEVGGCVRDELLGLQSKDVDFAVQARSFEQMERHIERLGLKIFLRKPEFLTIRAGVPNDHPLRKRCKDADFVLCRKDGPSSDGRHPDSVEAGTIFDDLARRDFTINAIARCADSGELLDPHGGVADLHARILRFVGDGEQRIREDALRILRGVRFALTKDLAVDDPWMFNSPAMLAGLTAVSTERIREELNKMLAFDTRRTLLTLEDFPNLRDVIFDRPDLSLEATMKKRR
ncbi:MAG: hypothetical protein AB7L09_01930 [Nitrospira sp.]